MRDRHVANPRLALAMRCAMLVLGLGVGCAGPPAEARSTVEQADEVGFTCLNALAPHVVSCQGTISIFQVTATVKHVQVLSDIELDVLTGDLDHLTVIDTNLLDGSTLLDDVGVTVLDAYLHDLAIELTRDDVTVCAAVSGTQVCE